MAQPQRQGAMEELAARMAAAHMRGQWQNETNRSATSCWQGDTLMPAPRGLPWIWPGATTLEFLKSAAEALPESLTARRSVLCNNPGIERGTVPTINMGIQMILPGELAWAHRHSISALRFVIKGQSDLVTAVDGTPCPMETGDLILTPATAWHDHYNGGKEPLMWLDVLDGPVMHAINQTVFQNYGERRQPLRNSASASNQGDDRDLASLRHPWSEVTKLLEQQRSAPVDPKRGCYHDYLDPRTGHHQMRTLGCRMTLLPPGFKGEPYRRRANAVCYAFKGAGTACVGDQSLNWTEGDCLAIPGWYERSFENSSTSDVYIFEVHDEPLLENLGLNDQTFPDLTGTNPS